MPQPLASPMTVDEFFRWQDADRALQLADGYPVLRRMLTGASNFHDFRRRELHRGARQPTSRRPLPRNHRGHGAPHLHPGAHRRT